MNERQFKNVIDNCRTKSGNDLKDYLSQFEDQPIVVSLLSGQEYDDIGLARTSARSAAQQVWPHFDDSEGTLTESIEVSHASNTPGIDGYNVDQLYLDLHMLDGLSGDRQIDFLADMFEDYAYPEVVSFAVLNDVGLGFGESTLATAFGVKDSLPFYESVVDILRDEEPLTEPEAGRPFRPMKAKSESHLPDDLSGWGAQRKIDGYRCLVHVGRSFEEYKEDESDENTVRAFSRRMNDITESLPELQEIGLADLDGHYILDCEVIAENGSYSDTSKRIGRKAENVDRDMEMNFKLFDVIMYRGIDVSGNPLQDRHSKLVSIAATLDDPRINHLGLIHDLTAAKEEAFDREDEGLIVKDLNGEYEFDKRSSNWVKLKFDAETLDVRIRNVLEGDKKNNGTMGKLAIESKDGTPLGHVGTGFSDQLRDEIWEDRGKWIGEVIEIEARGLDENLRMPAFQNVRLDGEADSYDRIVEIMREV